MQGICRSTLLACACLLLTGSAFGEDATSFIDPSDWTAGDPDSTYQEWDVLTVNTGNLPDLGYLTNPAISADPVLDILPPGFVSSSGNTYSYAGDYGVETLVYNHGGDYGVGGYVPGDGAYVMVQYAATQNPDCECAFYDDTIELVDLNGDPIPGGANEDIINYEVLFEGWVPSPYGDVLQEEVLIEFYLPGYTGDFRFHGDLIVHAGLRQLQVDTMIMGDAVDGDVDGDGDVDLADLAALLASFGLCDGDPGFNPAADIDANGCVDLADLAALLANFGYGT